VFAYQKASELIYSHIPVLHFLVGKTSNRKM